MDYISLDSNGFSAEEYQEVVLCLQTLLSVRAGSQPLDRDFGIDYDGIVDYPVNVAQNMLSLEIIDKVEKYEPRVKVMSVTYESGEYANGMLKPHVKFRKAED